MPNYTYDDFTRAAEAAGLSGSFDASDLTTAQKFPEYGLSLVSLKRDLGNAQTAEQRLLATEAMNQLRKNYGSYGVGEGANRSYATSYGSQIDQRMKDIGSYGPYSSTYGDQIDKALTDIGSYGDYKSPYADQISKALSDIGSYGSFAYSQENAYKNLLDRVINQRSFSYDPSSDPIFSSYKKAYNREGDRAAANALAAASAATGGRASSYANMAAQQANNYYAGKLADMIPTLRSQALSEYNNEYDQLLRQVNTLAGERSNEYQQYLDRLTQMQQNLQNLQGQDKTAYQQYLDRLSQMQQNLQNLQGQDATDYGRYTDQLTQMQQDLDNLRAQDATDYNRYLDELNAAYQRERDAEADKQTDFDNSLKVFQATGQITGPLADYLGGGSTYAGAASTYTGGGGGYGGGSYRGSSSGNKPTAADAAAQEEVNSILSKWGTSQITGQPYTDSNGNPFVHIGSWDEYQRLKELGSWTDAELNQAGISYGYPTTTDENGNLTPAVAYTTMGTDPNTGRAVAGTPMTWEQVDAAGGNYQAMVQRLQQLKDSGVSKSDVLADIRAFYQAGQITSSDYQRLYNQYRNMDSSEFGTPAGAATATTSTPATAAQTVDAVTGAAPVVSTPVYDWRGIPWAYSPDNPANKTTTPSATTSTTTTAKTTTPSATTTKTSGSSGGNLLTQLSNALKNALQLSGQMTQTAPGVGINPAGVSASSKSASSSTKSSNSGATKSTGTTVKSTSTSSPVSTLTSILNNVKPGSTLSSKSTSSKSSGTTTKKTTTTGGGKYASRSAR